MMKQQIVISGLGGQGVLFTTRLLAEAGVAMGADVLTSETHGMAMRGGTVMSHVKIGGFWSPLIRRGMADTGLFLAAATVSSHMNFLKEEGYAVINSPNGGDLSVDATAIARDMGSFLVTNLVLLGFAVQKGTLFCPGDVMRDVITALSPPRYRSVNTAAFDRGLTITGGPL